MRRIDVLVRDGRYEELAAYIRQEFGVEVDTELLKRKCSAYDSPADPRMWLKQRLGELDCFVGRALDEGEAAYRLVHLTVILHTGFLCIWETPEQLAQLRHVPEPPARDNTARSRVFSTLEVIRPVNKVTARVAPEPIPEDAAKKALEASKKIRARRGQKVLDTEGVQGVVVGIRQCRRKACLGVVLVTLWSDGEKTMPCTTGMNLGADDVWRIL